MKDEPTKTISLRNVEPMGISNQKDKITLEAKTDK